MKLSDRMKSYEHKFRHLLPEKAYSIIRIDGKAFGTYTGDLKKPYDEQFMSDMDSTAKFLCQNIQGVKIAYIQSDEISLVLTDFDNETTQAWFGRNIQKMVSVSASLATAKFNELRPNKLAFFDSRIFSIDSKVETMNYLIYRQEDACKNSIQMLARTLYSHKEVKDKSLDEMIVMCEKKQRSWETCPEGFQRGRIILKQDLVVKNENPTSFNPDPTFIRSSWEISPAFRFVKDKQKLLDLIIDVDNEKTKS